jgi:hypothetical protein
VFAAPETSVSVLNFDDRNAQFEVTQGTVDVYVRTLGNNDTIEIDTPNLAFVVRRPGEYRIDVAVNGESTVVSVPRGEGEAFGGNAAYVLRAGNSFRFFGSDLTDYESVPIARDTFTTWVAGRVQYRERSVSARYVSPDLIGYSDLDQYGTWRSVANYGSVWVPTNVPADWAPYRYGHWTWVDPWGWTWVDDAPWGFAPFHYGRWAYADNRWCWVPGPRNASPVYAPALVAFVGGDNFRLSVSSGPTDGVAWFPLAPGEVYRPAYTASREYFTRVNVTNTVVNVNNVTNVYNNPRTVSEVRYVNVNNVNAITAVPAQAFVQAQPVQRAKVRIDRAAIQNTQVVAAVPITPARESVLGSATPARAKPSQQVIERPVVAKQAPPAPPAPFQQREAALRQQPGKPLDQPDLAKGNGQKPNVRVVQAAPSAQPIPARAPEQPKGQREARQPAPAPAPQVAQPQPIPEQRRGPPEGRGQREAAKAPEPRRPTQAAPAPQPQVAQPQPIPEQHRGPPQREAQRAPEPPRPTQAAPAPQPQPAPHVAQPQPAPEQRRGPPQREAMRATEPPRPVQAAPAPQPHPAPQAAHPAAPPVVAQPAPEQRRGPPQRAAAPALEQPHAQPAPPPQHEAQPNDQERRAPRGKGNSEKDKRE